MESIQFNSTELGHCSGFLTIYFLKSPSVRKTYLTSNIFSVVINTFLSFVGTLANALIIAAFIRKRELRTTHNTLLVLLAIADLLVTAVVQMLDVIIQLGNVLGTFDCSLWNINTFISMFCLSVSVITISILSLERFITLAYPYRYQTIVSRRRLKIAVASSWLLILFMDGLHAIFNIPAVVFGFGATIVIFTMATVVLSWTWTLRLIRRHRNAIATTQTPFNIGRETKAQKKILRSTTTAFLIVGSLLVCYFPLPVVFILEAIQERQLDLNYYFFVRPCVATLMFANSAVNPCLVLWRNRDFRETAKNFFQQPVRTQAPTE